MPKFTTVITIAPKSNVITDKVKVQLYWGTPILRPHQKNKRKKEKRENVQQKLNKSLEQGLNLSGS